MSDPLSENESFFERNRASILADAPEGFSCAVVAEGRVIGYYQDLEEALPTWADHEGAAVKRLTQDQPALVASAFLTSD